MDRLDPETLELLRRINRSAEREAHHSETVGRLLEEIRCELADARRDVAGPRREARRALGGQARR